MKETTAMMPAARAGAADPVPNILWILCDQLRTDALQCYGNPYATMATPEIDRLAAGGTRFTQCFVNSPVCVPSRSSMLTGLPPERTGVYDNEAQAPGYPLGKNYLTVPEVFAAAGYTTATFGKSHVPQEIRPWMAENQQGAGMKETLGGFSAAGLHAVTRPSGTILAGTYPAGVNFPGNSVTERAVEFMEQAADPFFLRVSYLQPHSPIIVPRSHVGLYEGVDFGAGEDGTGGLSAFERRFMEVSDGASLPAAERARVRVLYYQLVGWIDTQVGRLLRCLDGRRLRSRTLVVFTSDHGTYLGEGGAFEKHTFAPQCHRVPLIVSAPGTAAGGEVRTDLVQGLDLPRTLCGLAGLAPGAGFGGRDIFADPAPEYVFGTIGYGAAESRAQPNVGCGTYYGERGWPRRACLRSARYRLDKNVRLDGRRLPRGHPDEDTFLADMERDPAERCNLAGDPRLGQVRLRLEEALEAHLADAAEPDTSEVYRAFRDAKRPVNVHAKRQGHLPGRGE